MNEEMKNEPVQRIRDDVDAAHTWAESLNQDVLNVDEMTFESAAAYLAKLREAIRLMRDSEAAIEAWMAEVWKDQGWRDPQVVQGVGEIEIRRAKNRKEWDHAGLQKAVLESLMRSRGGEVPTPWDVRDALMAAVGVAYWKVTELKRLGINVSEYCTEVPGNRKVEIRS